MHRSPFAPAEVIPPMEVEVRYPCPRCGHAMQRQGANLATCADCDLTIHQPHAGARTA